MGKKTNLLFSFPPFCWLPKNLQHFLAAHKIVPLHFGILLVLYFSLFFISFLEGALFIKNGIGIIQNPPFWAHLITGFFSIPIVAKISKNLSNALDNSSENLREYFYSSLSVSRLKQFVFELCIATALAAYAYNIVLAASYKINIYDSPLYVATFSLYLLIRAYIYFCYAITISTIFNSIIFLVLTLKKNDVKYFPFHIDKVGGLKKYFKAIDKPIYFLQSLAALIVLANYAGWRNFSTTPNLLGAGTLMVISVIAFIHYGAFRSVIKSKLKFEINNLRQRQYEIYQLIVFNNYDKTELKNLVEELESTERLIDLIKKTPKNGWGKYVANLIPLLIFNLDKLTGWTFSHYAQNVISSFRP